MCDLQRAKLKFGLLGGASALLVFLLLFLNTLATTLLGLFHRSGEAQLGRPHPVDTRRVVTEDAAAGGALRDQPRHACKSNRRRSS